MNHLFSPELIPDYMHAHPSFGVKRVLTYTIFRFFSFAGKENRDLAIRLKELLFPVETTLDFSVIESYLSEDLFFSPSLEEDSFDAFFLYAAVSIVENAFDEFSAGDALAVVDNLVISLYPVLCSAALDDTDTRLDAIVENGAEFYAALYLALTRYSSSLGIILPKLSSVYRPEFHFTGEDTVLCDFMDEYFETKNCVLQPSYTEMIDTLVQATLSYYKTDLDTLLSGDVSAMLSGTSSRFAMMKRFGFLTLGRTPGHDASLDTLREMLRYAAAYELRSNLFDYHLDEDNLITLDNWKEKLRWHYVQYSNVLTPALDMYYATVLSGRLLRAEFERELAALGFAVS